MQTEVTKAVGTIYWSGLFSFLFKDSRMTAIATVYTVGGFVIGADGRSRARGPDPTKVTEGMKARHDREDNRKIFCIADADKTLAYAFMGTVANDENTFDLYEETNRQSKLLSSRYFDTCYDYVYKLALGLKRAFNDARKDGRLDAWYSNEDLGEEDNLIARMMLVGYFRGKPSWTIAEFRSFDDRAKLQVQPIPTPGGIVTAGGKLMPKLLFQDKDPRFAQYIRPTGTDTTLEQGANAAKSFIEACSTPLAAELDPVCKSVGGHIHIAAVTPDGFKWLIPPKNLEP